MKEAVSLNLFHLNDIWRMEASSNIIKGILECFKFRAQPNVDVVSRYKKLGGSDNLTGFPTNQNLGDIPISGSRQQPVRWLSGS